MPPTLYSLGFRTRQEWVGQEEEKDEKAVGRDVGEGKRERHQGDFKVEIPFPSRSYSSLLNIIPLKKCNEKCIKNIFVCIFFPSLCWHIIQLYLAKRKHKLGTILKVHSSALLWTLHSPLFPSLTNFHSNLMIELCWPMHTCARTVQLNICTQFGDDFKKPFNGNFL